MCQKNHKAFIILLVHAELLLINVLFILISQFILSLFLSYIVWRVFQCPNFVCILFIMKGQIIISIMKTFTCVEIKFICIKFE